MIINDKRIEKYNAHEIFNILACDGYPAHQLDQTVTCGTIRVIVQNGYVARIYDAERYNIIRRAFATSLASNDEIANWIENNTKGVKTWQNRAVPSNGVQ